MINQQYSYGDFTGRSFLDRPAEEFNGTEIIGSSFYQEGPVSVNVFPPDMQGVTFHGCNLDNVVIPENNTVEDSCSCRRVAKQNDLEDWVLDADNNPNEPVAKKRYLRLGLSIDPQDLPTEALPESPAETAEMVLAAARERDRAQQQLDDLLGEG